MKASIFPHGSISSSIRTSVISSSIVLLGGIWLQYVEGDLLLITPLLLALPAMNAMASDLASIISAHISDPEGTIYTRKRLLKTMGLVAPFSAISVVLLSLFFAYIQGYEPSDRFIYQYAAFVLGVFITVTFVTVVLSSFLNRSLVMKGKNSDDVLMPMANIVASVIMLVAVSMAVLFLFN
jgi:cation transporter-like permease